MAEIWFALIWTYQVGMKTVFITVVDVGKVRQALGLPYLHMISAKDLAFFTLHQTGPLSGVLGEGRRHVTLMKAVENSSRKT